MNNKQVYLAGPCFSSAELMWNVAVKNELEILCKGKNVSFYLPQERVSDSCPPHKIQQELVSGLTRSHILIANLDGPGGDDGTCWEMGFVAGMNVMVNGWFGAFPTANFGWDRFKNIFWYRTDFRNGGDSDHNVNLMLAYGGKPITLTKDITPAGVAKAITNVLKLE